MDLDLLRAFVITAEEEHVGRAALRLNISPSPLSRSIQRLEAELGLTLFERQRQRLRLTDQGRRFQTEAQDLLDRARSLEQRARQWGRGISAEISLGCVPGAVQSPIILGILRQLRAATNGLAVRMVTERSAPLLDSLRRGRLDAGILYTPPQRPEPDLEIRHLSDTRFALVLPASHPLADFPQIEPDQLDGQPWITLDRAASSSFREGLLDACRACGFVPDIRAETNDLPSMLALVAAGLGFGLTMENLPDWMLPPGVVMRPFPAFPLKVSLYLAWRPGHVTAPVQALLNAAGIAK